MQDGKVLRGLDELKASREKNDQKLRLIKVIFYQQVDKALVDAPEATYADILEALDKQCDQQIAHNQNNEYAHMMKMIISVMQHYYARLNPDRAPAEWQLRS